MARGILLRNSSPLMRSLILAAIPLYTPSKHDVEEGGQILFHNFVREEFESEGLPADPLESSSSFNERGDSAEAASWDENDLRLRQGQRAQYEGAESLGVGTPDGYKNDEWSSYGRDLRKLADEFSKSRQAIEVRNKAQRVEVATISKEGFFNLCIELFREGFSTERVLALFCFCSTLLVRVMRLNGSSLTNILYAWSQEFIRGRICQWVYENGGWGKVLGRFYTVVKKIATLALISVGVVAGFIYIKKNW